MNQINAIWNENDPSPETLASQAEIAAAQAAAIEARGRWSATIEAGGTYKQGNTDSLDGLGKIEALHKTPKDLLKFYLSGKYSEKNDARSDAEAKLGSLYEYMISKHWYTYLKSELEYDEFENIDTRLTFSGGAGYYWLKKKHHELKTRAGLGYQHEKYRDYWKEDVKITGQTNDNVQLDIGLDYMVDLADWLKFTHSATYLPTFEGLDDYRLIFDSALLMPLGDSKNWKLKLGALHEYDAIPQTDHERLDETYYAAIVLNLNPD